MMFGYSVFNILVADNRRNYHTAIHNQSVIF